jgi:hypothetical protein
MMKVGLLWYDADPKRACQMKIDDAAERYLEKFGVPPNACHVNPRDKVSHPWLAVVANKAIRPNHFWLGIDEELEPVPVGEAIAKLGNRAKPSENPPARSRPGAHELERSESQKRQARGMLQAKSGVKAAATGPARRRVHA